MLLNLYVDGELPLDRQGELHAHLAGCAACRVQFNALMAFRLAVRQDALALAPAADERFLARIDALRRTRGEARPDRARPRRLIRDRVKTQGLTLAAVLAVVVGAWLATPEPAPAPEPEPPNELIIQLPAVTVESVVTPAALAE
jgi:anti-sigma factor RsiW